MRGTGTDATAPHPRRQRNTRNPLQSCSRPSAPATPIPKPEPQQNPGRQARCFRENGIQNDPRKKARWEPWLREPAPSIAVALFPNYASNLFYFIGTPNRRATPACHHGRHDGHRPSKEKQITTQREGPKRSKKHSRASPATWEKAKAISGLGF
ncbi:hypothetical protein LSM04_007789 [Trypanosoma melophagium]|uniref:uncharacterized protein n=1 Tax=Trypanosoma melophagium TaxID=715481 RepID=UPI00351A7136|nr:hypothetical protein LSM04_007789 [Trypanosoma melophagium]